MAKKVNTVRRLITFLVVSGALNIFLMGLLFYWNIRERPPTPYFELKPAASHEQKSPLAVDYSDSEVIRYFRRMPLEWLVSRLDNKQLVENGYTQRDLALASLIAFHHFDMDRALCGLPPPDQKRFIRYGKFRDGAPADLIVYPGLSDKHFAAVVSFAATERWPMTSKGMFMALQKEEKEQRDPSLVDAFLMTTDFTVLEMLFSRSGVPIDKEELLSVVLEGDWSQLAHFVEQQKAAQDLTPARRYGFLLDYIQKSSKAAAKLMLKIDGTFAARKFDDSQVLQLLSLLDDKSPEGEQFALFMLTSPRSDAVHKMAATRLYQYAREPVPENYRHEAALARFAPTHKVVQPAAPVSAKPSPVVSSPPPPRPQPKIAKPAPAPKKLQLPKPSVPIVTQRKIATPPAPKARYYVVQEGDSLWKISRRFNVDMEVIRAFNQLDSDSLRPGRTLKIP